MAEWILGIETTAEICSVALIDRNNFSDVKEISEGMTHSKSLAIFVDDLLKRNDLTARDLSAVAISSGPGSYTGLRIGTSLAKGLCFAHSIPLIAIDTLKSLAAKAIKKINEDVYYGPMMDARRMEVYFSVYDRELNQRQPVSPLIVEKGVMDDLTQEKELVVFGNGMNKSRDLLSSNKRIRFLEDIQLSALEVGELARPLFENKEFEDLAYFEPRYLKNFVAKPGKKLL